MNGWMDEDESEVGEKGWMDEDGLIWMDRELMVG